MQDVTSVGALPTARRRVRGVGEYYCVDCYFISEHLGTIAEHQADQARHYTFKQGLNRRLLMLWCDVRLK